MAFIKKLGNIIAGFVRAVPILVLMSVPLSIIGGLLFGPHGHPPPMVPATTEEVSGYTLSNGLADCKVYRVSEPHRADEDYRTYLAVRCPHSTVTTTYHVSGKYAHDEVSITSTP
jgi:hypothetical protein